VKAPRIMVKAPCIMVKAPRIMPKAPRIMPKEPRIMLKAPNKMWFDHLRQLWLSIKKAKSTFYDKKVRPKRTACISRSGNRT
jgi:hypothetical protein